jgi:hypothetical protein
MPPDEDDDQRVVRDRALEIARAIGDERTARSDARVWWIIIGCGLLYGGFGRVVFALDKLAPWLGGATSVSFLFLIPFAMGSLVAFLGMTLTERRSVAYWGLGIPTSCLGIGLAVALVTGVEAFFCILIASPILWALTIFGGLVTAAIVKRSSGGRTYITAVVLLPYAVAPVEQMIRLPEEILTVANRIEIAAPAEVVWGQIASVPEISRDELSWSWVHALGFPRPLAAVLAGEGVGAVRIATFEREVSFFERVTEWQPGHGIAFSIEADPQFVPANAFDQHVIVGGRFYDVLDGRYRIEPVGGDKVILHLSSRHRLNTHLGRYASWWSERIMDEIQGNILGVIRQRAEAQSRSFQ